MDVLDQIKYFIKINFTCFFFIYSYKIFIFDIYYTDIDISCESTDTDILMVWNKD